MGAVRCAECIVHEDIAIRGEPLRKGWIVALLTGVEANVLEEKEFARSQAANGIVGTNAERIASRWHIDANELCQSLRCRSQTQAVDNATIWSAKVRHDHDRRATIEKRLDSWNGGTDAGVVDDLPVGERHIEVNAQQHALPLHVELTNRALP
jgi:hypothetical protein